MAKTKKDEKSKKSKKVKENKSLTQQEIDKIIEPLEDWCRQAIKDRSKLSQRDCFDLGKYTARMDFKDIWDRGVAVSQFKGLF